MGSNPRLTKSRDFKQRYFDMKDQHDSTVSRLLVHKKQNYKKILKVSCLVPCHHTLGHLRKPFPVYVTSTFVGVLVASGGNIV